MYKTFIFSKCGTLSRKPKGGPVRGLLAGPHQLCAGSDTISLTHWVSQTTGLIISWGMDACILTDTVFKLLSYRWGWWIHCLSQVVLSYHQSLPRLITTATKQRFPKKQGSSGVSRKCTNRLVDENKADSVMVVVIANNDGDQSIFSYP